MYLRKIQVFEEGETKKKQKCLKKITPQRLKNIALFYLKRFETTVFSLRQVLYKRINDYAYQNKDFNKTEAYQWAEDILQDFVRYDYVNDERFAELKIRDYMAMGKSLRYIQAKLKEKGVSSDVIEKLFGELEYDEFESALNWAKKKHIGPFRGDEDSRLAHRQKDMAALARAGFSYDIIQKVFSSEDFF